jgi:phosphate:Na+ symporter
MKVMSDSLLNLAGNKMRSILASMTSNRFLGIFTGFFITSVIQSSSATTLMVVSFSNAGLLTLTEAISVIMGANIGTTITAWLITILGFKVSMSAIALPLVGLGFGLTFTQKERTKEIGTFFIGFALIFIGLEFLKEAMPDIKNNPSILSFLSKYTDLGYLSILLFLFIGTILTLVIQSSSATMALTLIMCAQGWIPFEMAAAMVLGENVGTTITANLAALVANYKAKQTARAHLIFNIMGVIWMLILFYPFLKFIVWLSIQFGSGSPYITAAAIPVAISLFHTTFNGCNTFLLLWFINPIARFVEKIVPVKLLPEKEVEEPKYLTADALKYPETAISILIKESKYLYKRPIFEIVTHSLNIHREDIKSDVKLKNVIKMSNEDLHTNVEDLYYTKVKTIYGQIIKFATTAQTQLHLTNEQNNILNEIKIANRKMVEILKNARELNKNVVLALENDNKHLQKEYDSLRRKVAKVLRVIYLFRKDTGDESKRSASKLKELKKSAKENIRTSNKSIDQLIRKELIDAEMASSLFNDYSNVNDMIKKLIEVAELLYGETDPLLEEAN